MPLAPPTGIETNHCQVGRSKHNVCAASRRVRHSRRSGRSSSPSPSGTCRTRRKVSWAGFNIHRTCQRQGMHTCRRAGMATRRRCGCPYRPALLEPLVTILSGRPAAPLAALSVIAEARPAPGVTRLVPVRVDGTPTTAGACPGGRRAPVAGHAARVADARAAHRPQRDDLGIRTCRNPRGVPLAHRRAGISRRTRSCALPRARRSAAGDRRRPSPLLPGRPARRAPADRIRRRQTCRPPSRTRSAV